MCFAKHCLDCSDRVHEQNVRDECMQILIQAQKLTFYSVFTDQQLGKCQISIAAWHFTATSIVLHAVTFAPFKAFKPVRISIVQVLPISLFFCGFLILGNLSLAYNTVGFYQLAKIMTTPTVVLLNFALFGITVSWQTLGSVIMSCFGVALVTTQFVLSNPFGTVIAVAAWTITALYQIWIGKKIKDLSVSAPQLLLNQAPVSVVLLLCFAPFVDTFPDFSIISANVLWTLFGSGILASLLNLSQFLIIGRTSALTVCDTALPSFLKWFALSPEFPSFFLVSPFADKQFCSSM